MMKGNNCILAIFGAVLILLQGVEANYTLNILLNEFNNGQGFLADGSHCDNFWFAGARCDIQLKIGVAFDSAATKCDINIDLGNVTTNANSIVFGQQTYGSWVNPSSFPKPDQYKGFLLCVTATEAKNNASIDKFNTPFIGADQISDFTYFSHSRGLIEPTMIAFAWFVQGDVSSPQPTAEPQTTTTTPAPGNGVMDCEAAYGGGSLKNKSDVVQLGLTNGNSVEVWCEYDGRQKTVQTVFQSRGSIDPYDPDFSNLNYTDFVENQGNPGPDKNFWMGLDNLWAFTTGRLARYDMSIMACCGNQLQVQQIYTNVTISDKASGYILNGVSADDSGLGLKSPASDFGQKFKDYDNFGSFPSFARCPVANLSIHNNTGGWWFGNCQNNLNGYYYYLSELNSTTTCSLGQKPLDKGTGVVLLNGTTSYYPDYNRISYTRVRMAFYRTGTPVVLDPSFCSGTPYQTLPTEAPFDESE